MKSTDSIDQCALKKLRKLGFELNGERSVEFYFYFPEEYQAHHVAAELNNLQFKTTIDYTEHRNHWFCLATKSINFSTERLTKMRCWMENLAHRYDGEYDGWGTGISL